MEFYSNFNRPPRKPESFTNQKQAVYKAVSDKTTGQRKLVVDKEINVYDKIQEYAEETKITNMLQRYNLDMLKQLTDDKEQLIDLTNLPENLMETMAIIDDAKYAWDRQSKEIKDKFNNNFNEFIAASENGQLADLLNKELQVSAEKFKTQNMANFAQSNINLQTYPQNVTTQPISSPQPVTQPVQTTQTTTQQGVNLNV